jgi:hypothetical protein
MPFKSEKQRKFMFANHPEIAERWTKEHGSKPVGRKTTVKRKHQVDAMGRMLRQMDKKK